MADNDPEVRLGYSSSMNISMAGTVETGVLRSEWDEMSDDEKETVIQETINELIEVFELADDEPDYTSYSRWSR